ncbi:MAG: DNA replication/repair protein RecF [Cyanobacteria bacterium P01_H01_bin.121]
MFLERLELQHFRNYQHQFIDFAAPKTILLGDNAQGKSNVLEAIELLATMRSHRVYRDRDLVQSGESCSKVQAILKRNDATTYLSMLLRTSGRRTVSLNQETLKRQLDLLGVLSIVQFSCLDLELVRGGPAERRRWLDNLLVQLEPYYAYLLHQYNRVLRQRNTVLKARQAGRLSRTKHKVYAQGPDSPTAKLQPTEGFATHAATPDVSADGAADDLGVWNTQLVAIGTRIIRRRARALDRLLPLACHWHQQLSGSEETLNLLYQPNTAGLELIQADDPQAIQAAFAEKLAARAEAELYQGSSLVGPHRDDLDMQVDGKPARYYSSQGQQRTIVLALKLAELKLIDSVIDDPPILLLDDVLAELDLKRQGQLLEAIHDRFQTLITTTHLNIFDQSWVQSAQLFTVRAGTLLESSSASV